MGYAADVAAVGIKSFLPEWCVLMEVQSVHLCVQPGRIVLFLLLASRPSCIWQLQPLLLAPNV